MRRVTRSHHQHTIREERRLHMDTLQKEIEMKRRQDEIVSREEYVYLQENNPLLKGVHAKAWRDVTNLQELNNLLEIAHPCLYRLTLMSTVMETVYEMYNINIKSSLPTCSFTGLPKSSLSLASSSSLSLVSSLLSSASSLSSPSSSLSSLSSQSLSSSSLSSPAPSYSFSSSSSSSSSSFILSSLLYTPSVLCMSSKTQSSICLSSSSSSSAPSNSYFLLRSQSLAPSSLPLLLYSKSENDKRARLIPVWFTLSKKTARRNTLCKSCTFIHNARIREQGRAEISNIPPDEHEHDVRYGYDAAYYRRLALANSETNNHKTVDDDDFNHTHNTNNTTDANHNKDDDDDDDDATSILAHFSKTRKKMKLDEQRKIEHANAKREQQQKEEETNVYDQLAYTQKYTKVGWAELCDTSYMPQVTFQQCYGPRTIAWLPLRLKHNVTWTAEDYNLGRDITVMQGFSQNYTIVVHADPLDYVALRNSSDQIGEMSNYIITTCADGLGLVVSHALGCLFEKLYPRESLENVSCLIVEYLCVSPLLPSSCPHT